MQSFKASVTLAWLLALCPAFAGTARYRACWRDTPATTMVIGWDQVDGSNPTLYYDTADHGTNTGAYAFSQTPDRVVSYKGMDNRFVRLAGLTADTTYYFVIADSNSTSARMKFRTAPDDDSPFTLIAGGDSRNNWDVRIDANRMAAKLKPLFILFGGDMTSGDTSSEWQAWFDHWQDTITSDGRLLPVVAARGNHEAGNASIVNLFDSPHPNVYFALTFGNDLLRTYTLNSEDVEGGNQASWLSSDLAAHQGVRWRFAQYHKPMRPHVSSKSEGNSEYNAWAQLFYDRAVQLVVECDSHMVKSTWPVRPSSGSGSDEGFIRDDAAGTVYVGEGTWGAPLRGADDAKSWTREAGSFNQFKWLEVTPAKVTLKTVQYGNVAAVGEVNEAAPYTPPAGLQTWGAVIELNAAGAPSVALTQPADGQLFQVGDTVTLAADAQSSSGSIASVTFAVDGSTLAVDGTAPYQTTWTAAAAGSYTLSATAVDDLGQEAGDQVNVSVGTAQVSRRVAAGADDAEEQGGTVDLTSTDLELIREAADQLVGMRFTNLPMPQGATITGATIRFTTDETSSEATSLVFYGQNSGNAPTFSTASGNIGNRAVTSAQVTWNPPAWNSVGESGAAQTTPDLSALVQEVVDRGDWAPGNAMVFIVDGSGKRVAESYNGSAAQAPLLTVSYTTGGGSGNQAPTAAFTHAANDLTVAFSDASSDSDGQVAAWAWDFGDGSGASVQHPAHTYAGAGTYTVTLTATDNDGAADTVAHQVTVDAGGGGGLESGVPFALPATAQGAWVQTTIDVPAGSALLAVDLAGGSGDADLYVRRGAAPTTADYDCRPYKSGNSETCSFSAPAADRWYVGVRAYAAFAGAVLTATVTPDGGGSGCPDTDQVTGLDGASGTWRYYTVEVPVCATGLTVSITGGSGDADLYVRSGAQPTTSSYDCRPYKNGNSETCNLTNPAPGTWHIGMRAYSAYSGVTLTTTID